MSDEPAPEPETKFVTVIYPPPDPITFTISRALAAKLVAIVVQETCLFTPHERNQLVVALIRALEE
jgi:hypothetical protein